jgi:hypothetical protein
MKTDVKLTKGEREAIANRIVALSDNELRPGKAKAGWIPPKYENGPNSVAAVVSKNRVSFLIRATQARDQARAEEFNPVQVDPSGIVGRNKDKYWFYGLRLGDLEKHEALFRAIVRDSVDTIISRRPKGK